MGIGAGELMKMMDEASFLPIALAASRSSEFDEGKYETQRFRPQIALDDGTNPVLHVWTTTRWECSNLQGVQMRSR